MKKNTGIFGFEEYQLKKMVFGMFLFLGDTVDSLTSISSKKNPTYFHVSWWVSKPFLI